MANISQSEIESLCPLSIEHKYIVAYCESKNLLTYDLRCLLEVKGHDLEFWKLNITVVR